MVQGLPKNCTERKVKKIFEEHALPNGRKAKVVKVNFAYYIGDYIEAKDKADTIRQRLNKEQ
jgi:hypothetical protein